MTKSKEGVISRSYARIKRGGMPEEKRSLRRPIRRWVDNKIDLGDSVGWYGLDRDKWKALVNTVMNHWLP
jgi:hypothetical protein